VDDRRWEDEDLAVTDASGLGGFLNRLTTS
jgi:hypothetical protein